MKNYLKLGLAAVFALAVTTAEAQQTDHKNHQDKSTRTNSQMYENNQSNSTQNGDYTTMRQGTNRSGGMDIMGAYSVEVLNAMNATIFALIDRSRIQNEKIQLLNQKTEILASIMAKEKRIRDVRSELSDIDNRLQTLEYYLNGRDNTPGSDKNQDKMPALERNEKINR